ncbi:hypothetical protein WJX84_005244 [Apatococcus fuscideae]|uniref:Protein-tyrosine-phosphatase n=1 Tax=Apatococcus fuscideae TaxID=2026836 RepID=A0AAW1T1W2_9CHLO
MKMALTADEYAQTERRVVSPFTYTEVAASAAARAFFYPSLLWNLARSRLQADWHWWDQITPTVLLGALPFESMLAELSSQGVKAVVTLNEDFEVFISSDKYKELGFDHLHLPTVDFLFAPVLSDLHKGVDFIQGHCKRGGQVYVHCKAGRGRSTTLVMCYLIRCCSMTPENALTHIQIRRPQVCLAPGQWAAILDFHASCQQKTSQEAPANLAPALAPTGLHSTHSQPTSHLEDSASDLLEPHRKGSAASLEDSATLQHEQHDATVPPFSKKTPDLHSPFDPTPVAQSLVDQPADSGCTSSPPEHASSSHPSAQRSTVALSEGRSQFKKSPAEVETTTLALNTLQATGYQQIDDWATLQPDGSMHDLPASSLWSW